MLSAALVGLVGSCTDSLKRLPQELALRMIDAVADSSASFVWVIEAHGEEATVKCDVVLLNGERHPLSVYTVSLIQGDTPCTTH